MLSKIRNSLTAFFPYLAKRDILKKTTDYYLNSPDFNGLPVRSFPDSAKTIKKLILAEKIDLVRGDGHPNPHIKALPPDTVEQQIQKIEANGLGEGCIYPTSQHLKNVVNTSDYPDEPFKLDIALGKPVLSHAAFDIRSLEYYLNDPRYHYEVSDSHGCIYLKDEVGGKISSHDDILLDRIGFCFLENRSGAIAVFYWDLLKLNREQQKLWKSRQIDEASRLHPAYFRTSIIGDFYEGCSIFRAVVYEIGFINELCNLINFRPMFKETFEESKYPKKFHFLIRPTESAYQDFVSLLDKILSENINPKLFAKDSMKKVGYTENGEKVTQMKGTLTALQEWLGEIYNFEDKNAPREILQSFRDVRKQRQKPAHKISLDEYDQKYFGMQADLLQDVWNSLSTIRSILAMHPKCQNFELPSWYDEEKIWLP